MGFLTTHVLDTMNGCPAAGMRVALYRLEGEAAQLLHELVLDDDGRAVGIFTDGDLRRLIERGDDLRALHAGEVMNARPKLVTAQALAVDAADLMERHRITGILVVNDAGRLVGALNSNDLMRAKVI